MAVNHQAEIIKAFFGDGSKWGVEIDYSLEKKSLSTMAPLKLITDLPDDFLVMNGDILTDLNYREFFEHHVANKNIFTISSYHRSHTMEYGVLETNKQNNLIGFIEKPKVDYQVSMGIYMVNKKALNFIPEDTKFGFDDLMLALLDKNLNPKVEKFSEYWMDIGRPDDYMKAIEDFESMKSKLLPNE